MESRVLTGPLILKEEFSQLRHNRLRSVNGLRLISQLGFGGRKRWRKSPNDFPGSSTRRPCQKPIRSSVIVNIESHDGLLKRPTCGLDYRQNRPRGVK